MIEVVLLGRLDQMLRVTERRRQEKHVIEAAPLASQLAPDVKLVNAGASLNRRSPAVPMGSPRVIAPFSKCASAPKARAGNMFRKLGGLCVGAAQLAGSRRG